MGYDPTGNWDWGGVLVGAALIGTGVAIGIWGGPLSLAGAAAVGYVIDMGLVTCYAAATDSAMVVDVSGSTGAAAYYFKGGTSAVIDFGDDNINLYAHFGGGLGFQGGPSISVGMVENYENPGDYAGPFVGYNAALMLGGEHCWNPEKKYGVGTMSRSVTFSGGLGLGVGIDYFSNPYQIIEW